MTILRKFLSSKRFLSYVFIVFLAPLHANAADKFQQKEKEICEAALEASDAGWAAYMVVKSDVSAISITSEACTSREYAVKKCESSVSQLVSNNLEHLMLQSFAFRYINKLNTLCEQYIRDSNRKLKLPEFDKIISGSVLKITEVELIKSGYAPAGESSLTLKELPSKSTFEISSTYFKKQNTNQITHSCLTLSVSMFALITETGPEELIDINGLFPLSICFDLTKTSTSKEFSSSLTKILQNRIK